MNFRSIKSLLGSIFIVVVISYIVISRVAQFTGPDDDSFKYPQNDREIEELYLGDSEANQYFKRWFYDEYKSQLYKFRIKIISKASEGEIRQHLFDEGIELRRKAAKPVADAPDQYLVSVLDSYVSLFSGVRDVSSPEECSELARTGSTNLAQHHTQIQISLDQQFLQMLMAWRFGLKEPIERENPSDSDWQAIADIMSENGKPERYYELVNNVNVDDPDYCNALIAFFTAIRDAEANVGERVRSDLIQKILSS